MTQLVATTAAHETIGAGLARARELWSRYAPVEAILDGIRQGEKRAAVSGLAGSATAFLLADLAERLTAPVLVLTAGADEAQDLYEDLAFLLGEPAVGHFPARQILPYDFRAPVGEIMGRRLAALAGLLDGSLRVLVAPARAVMEPTIPRSELLDARIELRRGGEMDLDDLVERLVRLGFHRVPLVEEVGDFAVRGGVIDFFSPGADAPVRVELCGDEVETLRHFDVTTQRTTEHLERVSVLPRREIPITHRTLEQYLARLPENDADLVRARYVNDPELPGLEWLAVAFGLPRGSLFEFLPEDTLVVAPPAEQLDAAMQEIMEEAARLRARLQERMSSLPRPREYYIPPEEVVDRLERHARIVLAPFKSGQRNTVDFRCEPHPALGSRLDLLVDLLRDFTRTGIHHLIATDTAGQAERLQALIAEKGGTDVASVVEVANLKGGFVCRDAGIAVLTDHEIFGRYHRRIRRKKFREGVAVADYAALSIGDYVVHSDYGIARYLGLQTLTVDGRSRDCLVLAYADNDRLYVPVEEFNRVGKYAGKDGAPELTRLGGTAWERTKARTRKAIEEMAADLLKLYAERKAHSGHAFPEDSTWYRQLEASFPFEETPDQQRAIDDVRRDMMSPRAMDRLICGDVGFGKTEVAIRAAFRAIDDGMQVAVLVPTTILAQQHFATFSERMRDFPVKIALLSRFRTRAQQQETVRELAEGKVDLVIGTHRLLSDDVRFKNLGLLIIDEEHRFGVRHKERLRRLRATVDTLTLTATPIPRTLQMALTGVRDMSLIATSPKDRLPIVTEIVEFDPAVIAAAILRELDRGGQVFFVHNRVQSIDAMHRFLKKIVPQAEIAVAHGQMHERSLESVMLAFLAGRFNVLLCTAIIESGLDIPNANTIIINRADRFGLAELYQLRGRVGRSSRRAYAYLLTPPMRLLRPDAVKRLRATEAHSDLGSGFALAMRDLEIRGAGTMLGPKQSGFIEEVGFDLYNKLLGEVIAELKGQTVTAPPDTRLECDLDFYLPDDYVGDRRHKVDIYRRLADCRTLEEIERIREEVIDRFGVLPQSGVNLFDAAAVKIAASRLEIEKVKLRGDRAWLFFGDNHKLTRREVEALRSATDCPMEFSLIGHPTVIVDLSLVAPTRRLPYLRGLLGKV